MIKVITYGTYDLLHYGHIRLLERAKALGDYLIVGVTSDDYDKTRGKINNQQSLMERIAGVEATGLADEIIVEEYEGQKIDDIKRLGIDIFTVGSDWEGQFDYLKEYCKVVYLPRTQGISSSEIRSKERQIRLGVVGSTELQKKYINEVKFVNGVDVVGVYAKGNKFDDGLVYTDSYDELLDMVDAVYIVTDPENRYADVKKALLSGKHVMCEPPISFSIEETIELYRIAKENDLILFDAIKTAYSTAYERLVLITKGGRIGKIMSVDSVCTSLKEDLNESGNNYYNRWSSMCGWAPFGLLPIFDILGTKYKSKSYIMKYVDREKHVDAFTKMDFVYDGAVASVRVAKGAKSEGELVITGTKGYIYVPAPWWKTDYFEVRFEDPQNNKRFFYQLDGEGIRYMLVMFAKSIQAGKMTSYVSEDVSLAISGVMEDFVKENDLTEI